MTSDQPPRVDSSATHDLAGCARLLGQPRALLWWLTRRGQFPAPADRRNGRPRWREGEIYQWAATRAPIALADRIPLTYWPDATHPAPYRGGRRLEHATLLSWQTPLGTLWLAWPDPGRPHSRVLARAHGELGEDAAAIVAVGGNFGFRGPAVHAILPTGVEYELAWPQLARVLGQPVPYWAYNLRSAELLTAWRPGAAQAIAPAIPDLDTTPLLRLAAVFDDGLPAGQVLVNLARVAQHRSTETALHDLQFLAECVQPGTTEVAATPMSVPADERADLDEDVRRVGWLEILGRADTLAISCVQEAMKWDGGDDFPYSNPEVVDTRTPCGAEWSKRLQPSRRTAAFEIMDKGGRPDGDTGCLIDPETDAPVTTTDIDHELSTAIPRRLPATSPLAEIILDQTIWVRTQDGILYPAPKHSYYGLSWGYPGTGPGTLALLIHRLLADVNAPGADSANGAPEGLEALTEIDWPRGTALSRAQLEAADDGRPPIKGPG